MAEKIRVLYVDDEPGLLDIGKVFLEQFGDFTVTTAISAPEALRLLEQEQFDTIISDYMMPGMDGIQFLIEVRKRFGAVPFILFTGKGREEVVIQAINSGADFYLQKGGNPQAQFAELIHKIKSAASSKRAADSLRESEEKYQVIVDHALEAIMIIDSSANVLFANPAAATLIGIEDSSACIGKNALEIIAPESREAALADFTLTMEGRGGYLAQYKIITATAQELWVELIGKKISFGGVPAVIVMFRDVTERKRADEALRESENRYRTLAESSIDDIFIIGRDDTIRFVNTHAAGNLHLPADEIIGKQRKKFFPLDIAEKQDTYLKEVFETGEPFHEDGKILYGNQEFWQNTSLVPLKDETGTVTAVFGVSRDITERKVAERALQRQSVTLSILNDIISTANKADDLPQLLENILTESLRLLDFDAGGIYLVDRLTRTANVVHSKNLPKEFLAEIQTAPIDKKPYDTLFIHNEPIITENYAKIAPDRSKKYGFQSMASIPLLSKGVAIGALNIVSMRRQVISEVEKQTLISISTELGSTIERMSAEEEITKAKENLETLFNSIDEMVFVLDMQGGILAVNETVEKRLSYTQRELAGTNVLLLHVPERRDEALRIVQGMIAGTIDSCLVPVLAKDGTRIEVETKVTRGWWNGSEVLIGVTRDITERQRMEEVLKQSEKKYRTLFEGALNPILIADEEGRYVDANAAALVFLETEKEEFIRKTVWDYSPQRLIEEQKHEHSAFTEPRTLETVYSVHGKEKTLILNIIPVDMLGKKYVIGIGQDITERKKMEEALRESEERFRLITETIDEAFWMADVEIGKIFYVSPSFERIWELSRESLYKNPRSFLDAVHKEDRERVLAELEIEKTGQPFDHEYRIVLPDGNIRNIWDRGFPIRDEKGQISIYVGVATDITESKRVEEALQLKDFAIESSINAIAIADLSGNLTDVNPAFLSIWGYEHRQEVLGRSVLSFWKVPSDAQQVIDGIQAQGTWSGEMTGQRKDGTPISVQLSANLIRDVAGTPVAMMGSFIDITERIRAQESLWKINQKLNVLSGLTRKELTNQVFVLNSYLEMLKKNAEGQETILENIQKCERAARSISEITEFTKNFQDMGARPAKWQNVKTALLLGLSHISIGKIQHSLETEDLEIFADPLLEDVCQHLFENSFLHGEHVTRIRVWHTATPCGVTIFFEDDGTGIPQEKKEQIFVRGGTVTHTSMRSLIFVREILDITGITIKETGEQGKGARFEMTVPKGTWRMNPDNGNMQGVGP